MTKRLFIAGLLLSGCASGSRTDPAVVSHHDAGVLTTDAGVDNSNSVDAGVDGHSSSLDAGIDTSTPTKDASVDNPKDVAVDSWVAPGSVSVGSPCANQSDCATGGCDYTGHCIASKSCIQLHGGNTCGGGEDTNLGSNPTPATGEESCCTSIPIAGTNYTVDKYLITAGRMRAFVNAYGGNLRSFTESIPASNTNWNPTWNQYMPSTTSEVDQAFGPYPNPLSPDPYSPNDETMDNADGIPLGWIGQWRYGCTQGNPLVAGGAPDGARTWYTDYMLPGDLAPIVYPQDYLDDKFMNCANSYAFTAFCIWDGGHLATLDELAAAWGSGDFPWSYLSPNVSINEVCLTEDAEGNCTDPTFQEPLGTDANGLDMSSYISHEFGGINWQFVNPFTYEYDPYELYADNSINIPPPGRFPLGNSKDGVSDLVGATYTLTSIIAGSNPSNSSSIANVDHVGSMNGSGSWEIHPVNPGSGTEQENPLFRPSEWAYWAGGGRCAR